MRLTLAVYLFFYRLSRALVNRPPISLRMLLSGMFALILLLLIGLFSFLIELIATNHVQMDTRSQLTELATTMADRLDRTLFERFREVDLIATTHDLLRNPAADVAQQRTLLETIQQSYPDYAWIGLMDRSGKVLVATQGTLEGKDVSADSWFQKGLKAPTIEDTDDPNTSHSSILNPQTKQAPLILANLAAPILAKDGSPQGVLGAQINWESAREIKTAVYRPVDTESMVEVFVFRPDGELILAPPTWQTRHVYTSIFMSDVVSSLLNSLQNSDSKFGNQIFSWPEEGRYVVGYAQSQGYRTYPGLGWLVVVRQPVGRAFASIPLLQRLIYLAGGLSILLFSLAAWLLTSRLTRQLQAISDSADRIRRGDPNVSIPLLSGSQEIATLSGSLHQLVEDLTTATTAERNRIARDLHDSVTQTLFSASLLADVMPKLWESDPARGRIKIDELRRSVRGALAEMRTLLLELRPASLIDAEMGRLLRQLADAANGRSGIDVTWEVSGDCELVPDVKIAFYRIIQEALNNVIKHSQATQAEISLRCDKRQIILTVCDNGCGFSPANTTGDHLGLRIMRERIEAIGGTLDIRSQANQGANQGTEIHVLLRREQAENVPELPYQPEIIAANSGSTAAPQNHEH